MCRRSFPVWTRTVNPEEIQLFAIKPLPVLQPHVLRVKLCSDCVWITVIMKRQFTAAFKTPKRIRVSLCCSWQKNPLFLHEFNSIFSCKNTQGYYKAYRTEMQKGKLLLTAAMLALKWPHNAVKIIVILTVKDCNKYSGKNLFKFLYAIVKN